MCSYSSNNKNRYKLDFNSDFCLNFWVHFKSGDFFLYESIGTDRRKFSAALFYDMFLIGKLS